MMSVSSSALSDMKDRLKPTVTRVISEDGRVRLERDGVTVVTEDTHPGFVIDNKPDLTISQILPWLFLSSQDVAGDSELLRTHNISHILNVASGLHIYREELTFVERKIELLDVPEQDIKEALSLCGDFLEDCRRSQRKVLVHCNAGISRSASVVIGYLITHHDLSYEEAFQLVKASRPSIRPNEGFVKQLKQLRKL